jgi:diguanylate cyclase (GGDEF)-like protein
MHEMQNILDLRTEELSHSLEESEKLRARFEEMSIIDSLTKLYNRRYFYTEVPAGLSRAIRYNKAFSLLLMDLDLFKQVNDTYGHACGDKALQALSDILRRFTREGDTLARLGGEEFVLALPETNSEGALKLAERIRATVADNDWICDGIEMNITISIGISSLGKNTENELQNIDAQLSDILREADRALYFVKQNGRNKVKSFMDIP